MPTERERESINFTHSLQNADVPDAGALHLASLSARQWQVLHSHLNFRTYGDNRTRASFVEGFRKHPFWAAAARAGSFNIEQIDRRLTSGYCHTLLPAHDRDGRPGCRLCRDYGWRPADLWKSTTLHFVKCPCPPDAEVEPDIPGTLTVIRRPLQPLAM